MAGKAKSWKLERATVHRRGATRSDSNKYSKSDTSRRSNSRSRIWVGGYTRSDGVEVAGHYRAA